jgi:hypothetical protein
LRGEVGRSATKEPKSTGRGGCATLSLGGAIESRRFCFWEESVNAETPRALRKSGEEARIQGETRGY